MTRLESIVEDKSNFTETADPRVPCAVICDTSSSMHGAPIAELNEGLRVLYDELAKDPVASRSVDLMVVTFGGKAEIVQRFATVETSFVPELTVTGDTPMGAGINLALDALEEQKRVYDARQISRRRAWAFLISDGAPTDEWLGAAMRAQLMQQDNRLLLYSIGVQGADLSTLGRFSTLAPLSLKGLRFGEMFKWLSKSMSTVSRRANTGPDDLPSVRDWAV